jgi:hypothetical protein
MATKPETLEPKPIYRVNQPPITPLQAAVEVDVTPTGEGMQIAPTRPSHETAPVTQYSPQFEPLRVPLAFAAGAGVIFVYTVTNIPRKWTVFVNRNSAVGCLVRVQCGSYDVTLIAGDECTFPGRSNQITVSNTIAAGDVTLIASGDDEVRF